MDIMKYLKFLNLIPLIVFFVVVRLGGMLISEYLLIMIVVLGVMNMCLAKGMKDYLFSSILLVVSTVVGVILLTLYYYYFVSNDFETPIVGAFAVLLYGLLAAVVAFVGTAVVVIKDKMAKKRGSRTIDE